MIGTSAILYEELDPSKKNGEWIDKSIQRLRMDWRPLVNLPRMSENKRLLDSMQSMEKIRESFKDKKFKEDTDFDPLGIMEPYKNAIIEELIKNPPRAELKATDPSAINEKKEDLQLLQSRRIIESDISKYQNQVGLPNYKVDPNKYKSNMGDFDKMGLDDQDQDDINFFENNFQRLVYEISGQSVINNILKTCRFDKEIIKKISRDILAAKVLAIQVYVDKITGEIKPRYIYPETAYGIFGDSSDGHDDICRGWQDNVTVMEWLQMVGNEFDWNKHWKMLLWAINYMNPSVKYTGFIRSGVKFDLFGNPEWTARIGMDGWQSNLLDWTMAYTYKVSVGYAEWKTNEATATYLLRKKDNVVVDTVAFSYDLKKNRQVREYQKESWYQQQWYSSYFLATTSVSQWIFNYGKVYYQTLYGANDEYSNGTLHYYQEEGRSAVEIAKPYIKMANFAFYRMLWVIHKAKPQEDEYLMEELIEVAKGFQQSYPQMGGQGKGPALQTIIKQVVQFQRENFVRIRAFPKADGKTVQQLPPLGGKENGIDPIAVAMESVIMWAESQISQKIGINPMRIGMNPPPRESNKTEQDTIQYSFNSTGYVYRMIQYLKERVSTCVLNYSQDILYYKDSIPYKWLMTIVGNEAIDGLSLLKDFCAHRYGIFVQDYNAGIDKQKINQAAEIAWQKGQLSFGQYNMITITEDYKKAAAILSHLELKKQKRERQEKLQELKIQQQMQQQKHDQDKDLEITKGKLALEVEKERTRGYIEAAKIGGDSRIKVKELTVENDPTKQAIKTESQKEVAEKKENLKESKPFPQAGAAA